MAKKRNANKAVDTSAASELRHNPFASLLGSAPEEEANPEAGEPASEARPGEPRFGAKVVVRKEKAGRGGKTVTRLSGLSAGHLEELAGALKRSLGCGAKIEPPDLLLLGDLVDRAAAWLEAEGAPRVVRGN